MKNCWQCGLRIILRNHNIVSGEKISLLNWSNIIFQCFEQHKQIPILPLCAAVVAEVSAGDISAPQQVKMKASSWLLAIPNIFFSKISSETMHKIMFCLLLYVWVERAIRRAKVLLLQCILVPWGGCGWRDWHLSQFEKVYFMFECQTLVKNNNSPRMLKISPSLFPINPLH